MPAAQGKHAGRARRTLDRATWKSLVTRTRMVPEEQGGRGQGGGGNGQWKRKGDSWGVEVCRLTTQFTYTVVF